VGKSALLERLSDGLDGWRVARAVGVESELELAYKAGCIRSARRCSSGSSDCPGRNAKRWRRCSGQARVLSRFLVALATLTLLADVAEQEPLVLSNPPMRARGLEPPRACAHRNLNPARLPVPPHPRGPTVADAGGGVGVDLGII
jgi:hypothetical protein